MDTFYLNQQINQIRNSLISSINNLLTQEEKFEFNRPFFYMDSNYPDIIYSIWGINREGLLFDSPVLEPKKLTISELPIETLMKIKDLMDLSIKQKSIEI